MNISLKQLTTGIAMASALAVSGAALAANTTDAAKGDAGVTGVAPKYPKLDKPADGAANNAATGTKGAFKAEGTAPAYPKMKTGDSGHSMKKDANDEGMKMKDGAQDQGVTGVAPKYPTKKQ